MSEPSPSKNTPPTHTGSVRAGGKIEADNIVTGTQIQGADAETARELLALTRELESGSVEAVRDIIAQNIVTGFQYIGQGGTAPNLEQFRQELAALRQQLAEAVKAGETADAYEAEDVQEAADRAVEQTQAQKPAAEKITPQLEKVTKIIDGAAKAAESAGKFQAAVVKLAPIAMALYRLAGWMFS
jgi:DNA repair exonuclease SbcCD ATPase subunit